MTCKPREKTWQKAHHRGYDVQNEREIQPKSPSSPPSLSPTQVNFWSETRNFKPLYKNSPSKLFLSLTGMKGKEIIEGDFLLEVCKGGFSVDSG